MPSLSRPRFDVHNLTSSDATPRPSGLPSRTARLRVTAERRRHEQELEVRAAEQREPVADPQPVAGSQQQQVEDRPSRPAISRAVSSSSSVLSSVPDDLDAPSKIFDGRASTANGFQATTSPAVQPGQAHGPSFGHLASQNSGFYPPVKTPTQGTSVAAQADPYRPVKATLPELQWLYKNVDIALNLEARVGKDPEDRFDDAKQIQDLIQTFKDMDMDKSFDDNEIKTCHVTHYGVFTILGNIRRALAPVSSASACSMKPCLQCQPC